VGRLSTDIDSRVVDCLPDDFPVAMASGDESLKLFLVGVLNRTRAVCRWGSASSSYYVPDGRSIASVEHTSGNRREKSFRPSSTGKNREIKKLPRQAAVLARSPILLEPIEVVQNGVRNFFVLAPHISHDYCSRQCRAGIIGVHGEQEIRCRYVSARAEMIHLIYHALGVSNPLAFGEVRQTS
jgi:hypothetical protein